VQDAQVYEGKLYPIGKDSLWGFADTTGLVRIPMAFEEIHDFRGELARVKVDGLYGFIDKGGSWRIKPKYESASDYDMWSKEVYASIGNRQFRITNQGRRSRIRHSQSRDAGGCRVTPPIRPERLFTIVGSQTYLTKQIFLRVDSSKVMEYTDSIPFRYDAVYEYSSEAILLKRDNKIALLPANRFRGENRYLYSSSINHPNEYQPQTIIDTLESRLKFIYDEVVPEPPYFSSGESEVARVRQGKYWGVIGHLGQPRTSVVYDSIISLNTVYAIVEYEKQRYGTVVFGEDAQEMFRRSQ